MRTTVSKLFILEHPVTGDEQHFWVDVEVTHDKEIHTLSNGDPGTPEFTNTSITGWGLCQDDTQPAWVEQWQIDEIVNDIDLSTIIDDEEESEEYDHDN
jgi:hypothetical protein